jgi:hypothetical protein
MSAVVVVLGSGWVEVDKEAVVAGGSGWVEEGSEREMCLWAISKYFGDLVSNTSAKM